MSRSCRTIARVSRRFAHKLALEGTGRLRGGRIVTVAGHCHCHRRRCYALARRRHRWGMGVKNRPLAPFRSVAVDPSHVSIGTRLYIPELDGMRMPGVAPWGGFVHDGCVVADDRGGNVGGRQLDLFAADRSFYRALFRLHHITAVHVYAGGRRCAAHRRTQVASRDRSST